jgi:hypothetical protein
VRPPIPSLAHCHDPDRSSTKLPRACLADAIKGAAADQEDGAPVPVTQVLASAGRVLEGTQAELVLQPLRLAFETKHIKLVEPALDCLHVIILLASFFPAHCSFSSPA